MSDPEPQDDLQALVQAVNDGDEGAASELFKALYSQLRVLARARLSSGPAMTLNPTSLVHEAFLRIDGSAPTSLNDSGHFIGIVGRVMRRVVVDHARRRRALKRGADPLMTTLAPDQADPRGGLSADELVALDTALQTLEARDANMARVVELKYFAGLSVGEIAEALEMSERSVHRLWQSARAWLLARLD